MRRHCATQQSMKPSKRRLLDFYAVALVVLFDCLPTGTAFSVSSLVQEQRKSSSVAIPPSSRRQSTRGLWAGSESLDEGNGSGSSNEVDLDFLKSELTAYLEKRKEQAADEKANEEVGKVVGGTKGNPILEYVSGSPNKAYVLEEAPNVFDYGELQKYGYGKLIDKIMKSGGRRAMYDLMDMVPPPPSKRLQPKQVPKLVIDKDGQTDKARYTGLKMGQVLDDDTMAQALQQAQEKSAAGERLRPKLEEEDFVLPFADKRNVAPKVTPDWTPESIDEYVAGKQKSVEYLREANMAGFERDPYESLDMDLSMKAYTVLSALLFSFAFGRATPLFLSDFLGFNGSIDILQGPALAIVLSSIGSSIVCALIFAPSKNRNSFIWGVKGLGAGPLALLQLRGLDMLLTKEEAAASGKEE